MGEAKINKKPWYKRLEFWGIIGTKVSALLMLFAPHTTAYQIGTGIGIIAGGAMSVKGLAKGYQADNLPEGLSKQLDKLPDSLTGVRGSHPKAQLQKIIDDKNAGK